MKHSVTILGAGASGLMCAIEAAKRGLKVVVLDHQREVGKKILISGGGRSNCTNLNLGPENYISENPHFVRSALSRFTPEDFLKLLDIHHIPYEEKKEDQIFCKRSSKDILRLLKEECLKCGVTIITGTKIVFVKFEDGFKIKIIKDEISSDSLVIATGGLSYPSLGATDLGMRLAKEFGLNVIEPSPALVPLVFDKKEKEVFSSLSGISFKAKVSCGKVSFKGEVLFTHKGLSGPSILQISSYWKRGDQISIDILPDIDVLSEVMTKKEAGEKTLLKNFLSGFIPKRFAEVWCEIYKLNGSVASYSKSELSKVSEGLHNWEFVPSGTEGYKKAEVMRGGVDTAEISSKTFESKKKKGLFFIGEVLDVTGHLGGYNLHWAWASGHAAGNSL